MEEIKPKNLDEERLKEFMEAIMAGTDICDACVYARIHPDEFAAHCLAHPGLSENLDRLKVLPKVESRISLRKGYTKDPDLALKHLKCIDRDTYSERSELTGKDGAELHITLD